MGQMVDGEWHAGEVTQDSGDGAYKRHDSGFRDWVTADGGPGPDGQAGHRAAPGRYLLYVSYACPWAHRTLIVRALKALDVMIDVAVVDPLMRENGWTFRNDSGVPGTTGDPLHGATHLWELYARARAGYSGKVTVPVLWDRERDTIVSNESAEIIRMLTQAWDGCGARPLDLYPPALRAAIDPLNARVYDDVNNGVYKAGFATTQAAYDAAVAPLFDTLDDLERRLTDAEWLVGNTLTEADIRLFTTLVRFDSVYHTHFKCNRRRIVDYPALSAFVARIAALPGVAPTIRLDHVTAHYYRSHRDLNPHGIVPIGPEPAFG